MKITTLDLMSKKVSVFMFCFFVAFSFLFVNVAKAGDYLHHAIAEQGGNRVFFVSAVLQKNGEASVVKLVQTTQSARSSAEAIGLFVEQIKVDVKGYSILDTLVTQSEETENSCTFI